MVGCRKIVLTSKYIKKKRRNILIVYKVKEILLRKKK